MTIIEDENQDTLIYDIETKVPGKTNPMVDEFKMFVAYSYKKKQKYVLTDLNDVRRIISEHKILVGFNNKGYDNPILERYGIIFNNKIIVDMMSIFLKRASQMKTKKGILNELLIEYSLDYITKTLDLVDEESSKIKIDYTKFKTWYDSDLQEITEYAIRDIDVTRKLYEWLEEYFWSFRFYLTDIDNKEKVYVNNSLTDVYYKAVCKRLGWKATYNRTKTFNKKITGGFSAYPSVKEIKDKKIKIYDFNSLYTFVGILCNIRGRHKDCTITDRPLFKASDKLNFVGEYYSDKLSEIDALHLEWYNDRLELKKINDPKEYCIKIFLNIGYGGLCEEYYEKIYDRIAANDVTTIGRQFSIIARKMFKENGYEVIYTDTDSVFLIDNFDDIDRLNAAKDKIIQYLLSLVPFATNAFDMKLEEHVRSIFFFEGKTKTVENELDEDDKENMKLGLMKKNYIYITESGKLVIKNLGIKKKSTSPLSKKIFWEHLVPLIKRDNNVTFNRGYIMALVNKLIDEDISSVALRKKVKDISQYENSRTGLHAQLAERYGAGIFFVVVNKRIGIGKKKKYCLLEEASRLTKNDLILDNIYKELKYFTKEVTYKTLGDF